MAGPGMNCKGPDVLPCRNSSTIHSEDVFLALSAALLPYHVLPIVETVCLSVDHLCLRL